MSQFGDFAPGLMCIPGASAPPVAKYATVENTGTATEGASTFTDMASLGTVDIEAASNYLGIFSMDGLNSSTTGTTESQVLVAGSSIHSTVLQNDVRNASEYRSHAGIFFIQNAGAATTKTIKLQGRRGTAGTATFRNRRLSLLKLTANDAFAESLGAQSSANPTNKSDVTAASLTFTPGSAGDYLIICSFTPRLDTQTNVYFGMKLTDGGGAMTEVGIRPEGGTQEPVVLMWKRTGISGSQTVNLVIRQTGSGSTTIGCAEIRMIAIRLDRFANSYVTTLGSDNSGTQTTYTSALSQTFTPPAADLLTLASWNQYGNGSANTASGQYVDDGTSLDEEITLDNFETAGNRGRPGFGHRLVAAANASRTQTIERKSSTSTAGIRIGAVIATLDLTGIS